MADLTTQMSNPSPVAPAGSSAPSGGSTPSSPSTIEVSAEDFKKLQSGSLADVLKGAQAVSDPKTGQVRITSSNPDVTSKLSDAISGGGSGGLLDSWTAASRKYSLPNPSTVAAATPTLGEIASGAAPILPHTPSATGPDAAPPPAGPAGDPAADAANQKLATGAAGAVSGAPKTGLFQLGDGSPTKISDSVPEQLPDPGKSSVNMPPLERARTDYKYEPIDAKKALNLLGDLPAAPQMKDEKTGQMRDIRPEDGIMSKQELDAFTSQKDEIVRLSKEAIQRNKWSEMAETLGHALAQLGAARQGLAYNRAGQAVNLSNLKFDKHDWLAENKLLIEQAKDDLDEAEKNRGASEARFKTIRDSLENYQKLKSQRAGDQARIQTEVDRTNADNQTKVTGINADNDRSNKTNAEHLAATGMTVQGENDRAAASDAVRRENNEKTNDTRAGLGAGKLNPADRDAAKLATKQDIAGRELAALWKDPKLHDEKWLALKARASGDSGIPQAELDRMQAEADREGSILPGRPSSKEVFARKIGEYVDGRAQRRGGGSAATAKEPDYESGIKQMMDQNPGASRQQVIDGLKAKGWLPHTFQ